MDPSAHRYRRADYDTVLRAGVRVMDQAAFLLARDHALPIYVFDVTEERCLGRVIAGENVGSHIAAGLPVELD